MDFAARIFHAYTYAIMRELSSSSKWVQAILIKIYAGRLLDLLGKMGIDFSKMSVEDWFKMLKEKGIVKNAYMRKIGDNLVEIIIEGCTLAPVIHAPLGMEGRTGDICPLSAMTMVLLALKSGWKRSEDINNYAKLTEDLTFFTKSGARTKLWVKL